MYLGMILLGAVHSLMLLPILLSWFGSHNVSRLSLLATLAAKAGVGNDLTAAQGGSGFRPYSTVSNYVDSSIFDDETTMNNH
jgi:hypothetical protein